LARISLGAGHSVRPVAAEMARYRIGAARLTHCAHIQGHAAGGGTAGGFFFCPGTPGGTPASLRGLTAPQKPLNLLAPPAGFEPATNRLTAVKLRAASGVGAGFSLPLPPQQNASVHADPWSSGECRLSRIGQIDFAGDRAARYKFGPISPILLTRARYVDFDRS
jgi:hypothetical protein